MGSDTTPAQLADTVNSGRFRSKNLTNIILSLFLILIFSLIVLFWLVIFRSSPGEPASDCNEVRCMIDHSLKTVTNLTGQIYFWSNVRSLCLISTLVFGTITALAVGLQDSTNAWWTKPTGIAATALGAACGTMISTLNVNYSIDKLIDIRSEIADMADNLQRNTRNKSQNEIDEQLDIFAHAYRKKADERLRVLGSAGRLNLQSKPTEK